MNIRLTCHNPIDWVMKMRETADTWCLDTENGKRWIRGSKSEMCNSWREKFGDTVSLTLGMDRSVSITLNKQKINNVFTALPQKQLWVVIETCVRKISIKQTGNKVYLLDECMYMYILHML